MRDKGSETDGFLLLILLLLRRLRLAQGFDAEEDPSASSSTSRRGRQYLPGYLFYTQPHIAKLSHRPAGGGDAAQGEGFVSRHIIRIWLVAKLSRFAHPLITSLGITQRVKIMKRNKICRPTIPVVGISS